MQLFPYARTSECIIRAVKHADLAVLEHLFEIGACEMTEGLCTIAAEDNSLETLEWQREQAHCPWDAYAIAQVTVKYPKSDEVLQYLYDQGESFTDEQLTELLMCSVSYVGTDAKLLVCAKWLRAHGAPWPEVLECVSQQNHGAELSTKDWPKAAVLWCRSEGCTAPLWSEVQANDE